MKRAKTQKCLAIRSRSRKTQRWSCVSPSTLFEYTWCHYEYRTHKTNNSSYRFLLETAWIHFLWQFVYIATTVSGTGNWDVWNDMNQSFLLVTSVKWASWIARRIHSNSVMCWSPSLTLRQIFNRILQSTSPVPTSDKSLLNAGQNCSVFAFCDITIARNQSETITAVTDIKQTHRHKLAQDRRRTPRQFDTDRR